MATSPDELSTLTSSPRSSASIEDAPEARILGAFLLANLFLRIALLPLNTAEYTDGVLQVTQSQEPTALWPPLYGWVTSAVSWIMPSLYGGRLVSALAGTLGLIPLWLLARRAGGRRAAFFAALLYTVAPVSLRWSARMMSDSLFAALFWAAVERWEAAEHGTRTESGDTGTRGTRVPHDGRLAVAMLWTVAATLTRYQGVLLVPLLGLTWLRSAWMALRTPSVPLPQVPPGSRFPWRTGVAALALLAIPFWMRLHGVAHSEQFADRLGGTLGSALAVMSINGEAFVLLTPYFLTYPVALCAALGIWCGGGRPARPLLAATVYVGLAVVLLQSAFSSFQERYLLPWLGLLWVWSGIGLGVARDSLARRPRLFSCAAAITLIWSALFALAVLVLQRQAFGDFADAGRWLRTNAPPDAPLYSTEVYNRSLGGQLIATNKIRFFTGRDVKFLPPPLAPNAPPPDLPDGAYVCFHSAYPSWSPETLSGFYRGHPVYETESALLPLFPDIMERPGTAQNPSAWLFRYELQRFWTVIWRVDGKRTPGEPDARRPAP